VGQAARLAEGRRAQTHGIFKYLVDGFTESMTVAHSGHSIGGPSLMAAEPYISSTIVAMAVCALRFTPHSGIFHQPIYDDSPDPSPLFPPHTPSFYFLVITRFTTNVKVVISSVAGVEMRSIGIESRAAKLVRFLHPSLDLSVIKLGDSASCT